MIIETSGSKGHVVKCLPPLTIETDLLAKGLNILTTAAAEVAVKFGGAAAVVNGMSQNGKHLASTGEQR